MIYTITLVKTGHVNWIGLVTRPNGTEAHELYYAGSDCWEADYKHISASGFKWAARMGARRWARKDAKVVRSRVNPAVEQYQL